MKQHKCIKRGVSIEEANDFFSSLVQSQPLQEGKYVVYYSTRDNALYWGKLKWGVCKYRRDNDCIERGCRGGLSTWDRPSLCPCIHQKLLMAHIHYDELLMRLFL